MTNEVELRREAYSLIPDRKENEDKEAFVMRVLQRLHKKKQAKLRLQGLIEANSFRKTGYAVRNSKSIKNKIGKGPSPHKPITSKRGNNNNLFGRDD